MEARLAQIPMPSARATPASYRHEGNPRKKTATRTRTIDSCHHLIHQAGRSQTTSLPTDEITLHTSQFPHSYPPAVEMRVVAIEPIFLFPSGKRGRSRISADVFRLRDVAGLPRDVGLVSGTPSNAARRIPLRGSNSLGGCWGTQKSRRPSATCNWTIRSCRRAGSWWNRAVSTILAPPDDPFPLPPPAIRGQSGGIMKWRCIAALIQDFGLDSFFGMKSTQESVCCDDEMFHRQPNPIPKDRSSPKS